jgi:hypothetical protein
VGINPIGKMVARRRKHHPRGCSGRDSRIRINHYENNSTFATWTPLPILESFLFNYLENSLMIRVWNQEICSFYDLKFELCVANMMATGDLHGR